MLNGGLENSTPVSPYLDVVSPSLWLPNPRHEQFARLVAAGATGKAAYVGAGYRQRGATSNACSIRKLILQQCKIVGRLRIVYLYLAPALFTCCLRGGELGRSA